MGTWTRIAIFISWICATYAEDLVICLKNTLVACKDFAFSTVETLSDSTTETWLGYLRRIMVCPMVTIWDCLREARGWCPPTPSAFPPTLSSTSPTGPWATGCRGEPRRRLLINASLWDCLKDQTILRATMFLIREWSSDSPRDRWRSFWPSKEELHVSSDLL